MTKEALGMTSLLVRRCHLRCFACEREHTTGRCLTQLRHLAVHDHELEGDVGELADAEAVRLPRNEILERPGRALDRERIVWPQHNFDLCSAGRLVGSYVLP